MNISKKVIFISIILASLNFLSFSQDKTSASASQNQTQENTSSVDNSLPSQTEVPFYINSNDTTNQTRGRFSTLLLFLRMILVLAFVIACIYGVMWLLKKSMKVTPNMNDPFLRRVSSIDLVPGKSVHVVTLLDRAYVVGVSDNSVSLIGEFSSETESDKELINAMNLYADEHQNVKKPKNFAEILEIFMPGSSKEKGGIFSDAQKKMEKNLHNQRNKLNGGE